MQAIARLKFLPWLLLVLFLFGTFMAWREEVREHGLQSRARFDFETSRMETAITKRIKALEGALRFGEGLLAGEGRVSPEEWRRFTAALDIEQAYPTIGVLSYVSTPGADGRYLTEFTEPSDSPGLGMDIATDIQRRTAVEQARDSGQAVLTGLTSSVAPGEGMANMSLFLPVYQSTPVPSTVEERNRLIKGWIGAAFDSGALVEAALGTVNPEIHLEIFEGGSVDTERVLYDSDQRLVGNPNLSKATYTRISRFNVGGRVWSLAFSTTAVFDRATLRYHHLLFLGAGFAFSVAVWFAAHLIVRGHERALAMAADMTKALHESEERIRLITDSVPVLISYVDGDRRYRFANRQYRDWFGFTPQQIVGKTVAEVLGRDPYKHTKPFIDRVLSGEQAVFELDVKTASGDTRSLFTTLIPHRAEDGRVEGYFVLGEDTTERKQLIEHLERSNAELEQFAYVASHDLQEPLRMVSSYIQLLERRHGDELSGESREFMGFAVEGAKRMQNMITDLLRFSRIGSRGKELAPVSSSAALEEALENLSGIIEESGAKVTHSRLPKVLADQSQLVRLFQNLIGNGIKYQEQDIKPIITVKAKRRDGLVEFAVSDNGIGISPDYADRIFMIFQRLHGREVYKGTGIGLAICKKIVERHGGTIWVESDIGRGATFKFTLQAAS